MRIFVLSRVRMSTFDRLFFIILYHKKKLVGLRIVPATRGLDASGSHQRLLNYAALNSGT
jgi:hypothetical protein